MLEGGEQTFMDFLEITIPEALVFVSRIVVGWHSCSGLRYVMREGLPRFPIL